MARICVLGGGLVGRFVACTLYEREHHVTVIDAEHLEGLPVGINCIQSFVNPDMIPETVSGFDVVVNCLPGRIGHAVWGPLLSIEGMSVADLAFTAEDPRMYDELANERKSRMIYDVGIAPGLSNALLMSAQMECEALSSARIWVGGNPQEPDGEWAYMAPFSPSENYSI